jgi:hypothetical protein
MKMNYNKQFDWFLAINLEKILNRKQFELLSYFLFEFIYILYMFFYLHEQ